MLSRSKSRIIATRDFRKSTITQWFSEVEKLGRIALVRFDASRYFCVIRCLIYGSTQYPRKTKLSKSKFEKPFQRAARYQS